MSALEPFDAQTMPLGGVRLIEASAGTGKTFSLAGLHLRLIVERGLDVREILVVTFTRAAAQELRERLRARLALAARIAAEPACQRSDGAEAFVEDVLANAAEDRAALAGRLRDAATRVDQATITTIHGFAQRAGADTAFESALPFDRGDQVDDNDVRQEAAGDYWRRQVIGQPAATAAAFLEIWGSPTALYRDIRPILAKPHTRLVAPDPRKLEQRRKAALKAWKADRAAFAQLLADAAAGDTFLKTSTLGARLEREGPDGLLAAIDAGLAGTADGLPALPAEVADLATDEDVRGHVKKTAAGWFRPQDLTVTPLLAALQVDGRLAACATAVEAVRALSTERKTERHQFSFDDMISALHAAVTEPQGGPALAAALRRTWPWALVDEFQDTDPVQYAILRAIYRPAAPAGDEIGLILIGDPKQAIYGFRGGDVFAYLEAANDADGRYGMEVNFRSTPAVLAGLHALFGHADNAFVLKGIGFPAVTAGREPDARRLALDGRAVPGVTAWALPEGPGNAKGKLQPILCAATVARIAELLDPARGHRVDSDGQGRPVKPGDIAVLVNSNQEAAELQRRLSEARVPAVCIHQQSVFASAEAGDLLAVLEAAAAPLAGERTRVALMGPLFGYRLGDLAALATDEEAWEAVTDTFRTAHARWSRAGVLGMLEPVLQDAAPRIAGLVDGERRMTNYLHLAERLQEAEHEVFGMAGLLRWLREAMDAAAGGESSDADRLRLADDADLVQVTTVHKAKGLQFPIVFVPYAPWTGTMGQPDKPPLEFHDGAGRATLDLGSERAGIDAPTAVRERRAEAVRLLYVALTRAEQACFFAWGAANGAADGPLAWLLHQADGAAAEAWGGARNLPGWLKPAQAALRLRAVAEHSDGALAVEALADEPPAPPRTAAAANGRSLAPPREDFPDARAPWSIFSFSRLAGGLEAPVEPTGGGDDEHESADSSAADEAEATEVVTWPRGRGFGQAFHDLLQDADFSSCTNPETNPGKDLPIRIAAALRNHGVPNADPAARGGPVERTAALIEATLHAALPTIGPLAGVPEAARRAELEFFLRLGGADAEQVLAAMAAHGYGEPRGGSADALRGLMHGFIDVVAEVDGQFWILDYKTNLLGPRRRDYAPEALERAVRRHHYDLQYLIYSVALHRHLRLRLPGYDPQRHLGGVQYLFVRGMAAGDGRHGIHLDRPPVALIEQLDALFDGREPVA